MAITNRTPVQLEMKLFTLFIRLRMFHFSGWVFKNEFPSLLYRVSSLPTYFVGSKQKGENVMRVRKIKMAWFPELYLVEILLFCGQVNYFYEPFLSKNFFFLATFE